MSVVAKRAYDIARRPEYAARKKQLRKERWVGKEAEAAARRRADRSYWPVVMLPNIRHRAKKNGLEFNIDASDIVVPERCPVLGIPLILGLNGKLAHNPNSPSVDRIDNSKGYVKGNVCVISMRANLLKKDATLDEIRRIAAYIEKVLPSPQ